MTREAKTQHGTVGILIEAPTATTLVAARAAIMEILVSSNAEAVKIKALDVLRVLGHTEAVVSNCTVTQGAP